MRGKVAFPTTGQLSLSLSSDGNTLAVGASREPSSQNTITNGFTASQDVAAAGAGAVYILTRVGSSWFQQNYLKAPNVRAGASYGASLAISGDGRAIYVGAPNESSNQSTVTMGTDASGNTSAPTAGAVYSITTSP